MGYLELCVVGVLLKGSAQFGKAGADAGIVHRVVKLYGETSDNVGVCFCHQLHLFLGVVCNNLFRNRLGLFVGRQGCGELRQDYVPAVTIEVEIGVADVFQIDGAVFPYHEREECHGGLAHMRGEDVGDDANLLVGLHIRVVEDHVENTVLVAHLAHQSHIFGHAVLLLCFARKQEECLCVIYIDLVVLHGTCVFTNSDGRFLIRAV